MATHNKDLIEFYDGTGCIAAVKSSIVPPVGAVICIRKRPWTVHQVTYALDYADDYERSLMRVNVDLVPCAIPVTDKPQPPTQPTTEEPLC
jgi:hypothetical protein